ncbi:MAG: hypothetical protein GY953_27570, partial [bacterium]|nr:hypothetical protein [bacterium]
MVRLLASCLLALTCFAAEPLFHQSGFTKDSVQPWRLWTPRDETAPQLGVNDAEFRTQPGSLSVAGASNIAVLGGWERVVDGIQPGHWYRFVAHYKAERLDYEPRQVVPRLDWLTASGKRAGKPEYVYHTEPGQ